MAIIAALLEAAKGLGAADLEVYSDSVLAIHQLTNRSRSKASHSLQLRDEARVAASDLRLTYFQYPRQLTSRPTRLWATTADSESLHRWLRASPSTMNPPSNERAWVASVLKPEAPCLYHEGGGEDHQVAKDPGARCIVCGDLSVAGCHGSPLACNCRSPCSQAARSSAGSKFWLRRAEVNLRRGSPVRSSALECSTRLHCVAPGPALANDALCFASECDAQFRPPSLNRKS